jgi:hypothetical protein
MIPTLEFPPFTPFTSQVTLWSVAFATLALNCSVAAEGTFAVLGESET